MTVCSQCSWLPRCGRWTSSTQSTVVRTPPRCIFPGEWAVGNFPLCLHILFVFLSTWPYFISINTEALRLCVYLTIHVTHSPVQVFLSISLPAVCVLCPVQRSILVPPVPVPLAHDSGELLVCVVCVGGWQGFVCGCVCRGRVRLLFCCIIRNI